MIVADLIFNNMKKIIAYPLTWLFYYLGDGISKLFWTKLCDVQTIADISYYFYNTFMCWSVATQDWAGLQKPWEFISQDEKR